MRQQVNAFSERVPPQNLEAEASVLGACLVDKQAWIKVQAALTSQDFYADKNGHVWAAMHRAQKAQGIVDLITVQDALMNERESDGKGTRLDDIGGITYLTSLVNMVPTTANVEQYAEIVATKATLRRIQDGARKTIETCYETDDPAEALSALQQAGSAEAKRTNRKGLRPISGRIGDYALQRYNQRHLPNADWIPSRIPELREKCPWLLTEVTILAMPPNNGKTTMAVAEADFLSALGYEVAFFELEMREQSIFDKLIALNAGLNTRAIRMGLLTDAEWIRWLHHSECLDARANLSLNNETAETMSNIRYQCLRRVAERGRLDMVIIDFLERAKENRQTKDERYDQLLARIAEIAQGIARECNCHVLILAQVDVKVMNRPNPIPTLEDLANSKTNLAAWPDNIITGVQPHKCKGDGRIKPKIKGVECTDKRFENTLVLSVAKSRFGADATIPIYADLATGLLGTILEPWPWHMKCAEAKPKEKHDPKECALGSKCGLLMPGERNEPADTRHFEAMKVFRDKAVAASAPALAEPEF